jgi:hypothetical protein
MTTGILINDIELAYAPISAYHFNLLIRDKMFYENLTDSHLYIIAQRHELTFYNFSLSNDLVLRFEIRQEKNSRLVECHLPLKQNKININLNNFIELRLHDRRTIGGQKIEAPFNGTQGFTIQERNPNTNETKAIIWLTPDKLFYKFWRKELYAEFSISFLSMLNFNIHYIGKSTEQNICTRLSKHSTFQEILVNQQPLTYKNIPSNEIMILLLRLNDNNTIVKWGVDSQPEEISNYILNYTLPTDKIISSDAEKALIKHLQPSYNRTLYNSFPTEKDLINQDFHNIILYGFIDPIILLYENGKVVGSPNSDIRDYIPVER